MSDSAPAQPSSTTTTTIPDYAKPYVENMLGKTDALASQPSQLYGQNRQADFTGLQNKAFESATNMAPTAQGAVATDLATRAGLGALNTQYQGGPFGVNQIQAGPLQTFQMGQAQQVGTQSMTQPGAVEQYMSPYMQNVVDIQQREAQRQADIAGTQRNAQATTAGAFGGARQAIMDAEAARNLATQKGDIQATGQQAAFQTAQQQFNTEQNARMQAQLANQQAGLAGAQQNLNAQLGVQQLGAGQNMQAQLANQQAAVQAQNAAEQSRQYGAGLGMQGIQTAGQMAGQLGSLGQQQFGQQMDTARLQNQYGAQQQNWQQQALTQQYQDFLDQKNEPYKQVGFMSDMLRGLPLSNQTVYQPSPSMTNQLVGAGTALYGASKAGMFAEGGAIKKAAKRKQPTGLAELVIHKIG